MDILKPALSDALAQTLWARTLSPEQLARVERETSVGLIRELLCDLQDRKRANFLDKRTTRKGPRRSLNLDGVKALPLLPPDTWPMTRAP